MKLILLITVVMLAACGGPRSTLHEKGIVNIHQATAQNDAIAKSIEDDKPYQAAGIRNNSAAVKAIVDIGSNEEAKKLILELSKNYQLLVDGLAEDWKDERKAYETQVDLNNKAIEDTKKEAESLKWWLKLGGVVAAVALAARIAANLGLPLGVVGTRVASFIGGLGNLPERIKNLKTLSVSADEGVKELQKTEKEVDTLLQGKVTEAVKKVTNGKFTSLADLWKAAAEAAAVDQGNYAGAKKELEKIRDETPSNELETLKG